MILQPLKRKDVEGFILKQKGSKLDFPFGEEVAVYKVKDKMFALIPEGKEPISISLKCAPELAIILQEKYESVMPGHHLNKKHWITIVLTGQLPLNEVKDLIVLSYNLVNSTKESNSEI
jgi:predicted DNA-binding protein (MmcQ/YjbR family)